jgi:signal transduction histidine kinase
MAEVATSVLHNVGNVLNSANVSVAMMSSRLKEGKFEALTRLGRLLADHAQRPDFLSADEKGRKVPVYLEQLAHRFTDEQRAIVGELASLRKNIEHIEDIVQMQQNYSRLHSVRELLKVADLVEEAVRLSGVGTAHRRLRIEREIDQQLSALIDKPKVLQILVNFLRNASYACGEGGRTDGAIKIRVVTTDTQMLRFEVHDNGVGITQETLSRLFAQGFTTRKDGHGYGLHSSALAAKSLGGSVSARSPGLGEGAVFTVEIPFATSEPPAVV